MIMVAVSCGETGGEAPGIATESNCGGVVVGGACWYLAADNESCTTACASHGGYNEATNTYAGTGGSNANCDSVFAGLGVGGGTSQDPGVCNAGYGCHYDVALTQRYRCVNPATTENALITGLQRVCACNE